MASTAEHASTDDRATALDCHTRAHHFALQQALYRHVVCDDATDVRIRLVLGLCLLASCKVPDKPELGPDAAGVDAGADGDARDPRLPDLDAAIDAPPDADPSVPDTTPPSLVGVTPAAGTSVWLHAPIRLLFDEPLGADIGGTAVTVRVGGVAIAASVALEDPRTLVVTVAPAARGVGALELHADIEVADLAGNVLATAVDTSLMVPAWHSPSIDRGNVASTPSFVVDARGNVIATWLVGGAGARRAVIAELAASSWTSLGGTLGTGDVTSSSIAFDSGGAPLVAYSDGGVVHVARWDASTWTELASPGSAAHVALATPPGAAPIVAMFGTAAATVAVRTLAGGAWQPIGSDIALSASVASEPALAAPSASTAVVGWIDNAQQLRVYRVAAATTTPLAPLPVSAGSRMSLAARGSTVAIAWDQWGGSYGVLAATAGGGATTWTQLGKPLDIDITGDARAPAIAFDGGGAPVVAWTELVETAQRGALARWSGSAWTIVGGVSWLPSATARPSGTRLALDATGAAIVATNNTGNVHVARFNGPSTPALGIASRASLSGCSIDAGAPPALLSQTGCFTFAQALRPVAHAGLVPFDVVSELWSDGAKKRRWIGLPAGRSMTLAGNGSWTAPVGTLLVKEFALETTPGNPATRRPVETRFLINDASLGWQGFTYRWNTSGTDATLLADGQFTINWQMDDGSQHAHVYPSRAHCRSCHTAAHGPVLGMRPEQLARWYDYDGVIADQLATLAQLGVGPATTPIAFTAPHDPTATAERRMRGYMHANCAHCHNPQYITIKDLRFTTPLASTRLCEAITPGSPEQSVVYQRVTSRPGMPPLGTAAVDPLARDLLGRWITGMTSCP